MSIRPEHMELLLNSAITEDVIKASGIRSTATGLEFPWNDGNGATVWQTRDDKPVTDAEGRVVKYRFPKNARAPFHRLRDTDPTSRMIIAEGTKQSYAVLSHAPADMAVYGMSGCWGYVHADLTVAKGRDVFLLLDADYATNADVYEAAAKLTDKLKKHGATSVRYVSTTGEGKDGVDDVLAGLKPEQRGEYLRLWLSQASDKLGKRPKRKAERSETDEAALKYFRQRDKPIAFQPVDFATELLAEIPAAITAEKNIAMYLGGVYQINPDAVLSAVVKRLGNYYQPSHTGAVMDTLKALLSDADAYLPERMEEPLLNCPNTMVDLRNGKKLDHDPAYLSSVQVAVDYRPDMGTPVYDAWVREALRQPHHSDADVDALVDDLEETAGTMLDPSRTPSKVLFLFGPSRSGKSTFLRLLKAIAGKPATSAVTLHDLGKDQFASANLYGKMLNVAADLSNEHVKDLSRFKMATGEDVMNGNRKYGQQFTFTNQALFAFSANDLPTVSEASRAYAERSKPFWFPNSFAGREDKHLEAKLLAELPGILARWVKAYARFLQRGGYAPSDAATMAHFEAKSDRVHRFFQEVCTAHTATYRQRMSSGQATARKDVYAAFNAWAAESGSNKIGRNTFYERMAAIPGVVDVVLGNSDRAYNVTLLDMAQDKWDDWDGEVPSDTPAGEITADPIAASGVDDDWSMKPDPFAPGGELPYQF